MYDTEVRTALSALDLGDPGPARRVLEAIVMRRENAFEALCALAARERWCWRLDCGTCGNGVSRWGLRALARGAHPAEAGWSVHWREGEGMMATLEAIQGPMPNQRDWSMREQQRLQRIVARARLTKIAAVAPFPDWLGYIGLALTYTEQAEAATPRLTHALVPQFRPFVCERSAGADLLARLERDAERRLHWGDLGQLERSWRRHPEP